MTSELIADLTEQIGRMSARIGELAPDFEVGDVAFSPMGRELTITGRHWCYETTPDITDWGGCGLAEDYLSKMKP